MLSTDEKIALLATAAIGDGVADDMTSDRLPDVVWSYKTCKAFLMTAATMLQQAGLRVTTEEQPGYRFFCVRVDAGKCRFLMIKQRQDDRATEVTVGWPVIHYDEPRGWRLWRRKVTTCCRDVQTCDDAYAALRLAATVISRDWRKPLRPQARASVLLQPNYI